jgi:hypothetical protein
LFIQEKQKKISIFASSQFNIAKRNNIFTIIDNILDFSFHFSGSINLIFGDGSIFFFFAILIRFYIMVEGIMFIFIIR